MCIEQDFLNSDFLRGVVNEILSQSRQDDGHRATRSLRHESIEPGDVKTAIAAAANSDGDLSAISVKDRLILSSYYDPQDIPLGIENQIVSGDEEKLSANSLLT